VTTEWYYTTNKQQMGPVTWNELCELAEVGILKPHDMVWTDGMDEWVKAISQRELFTAGDSEAGAPMQKASYADAKPRPGRRTKRRVDDVYEDDKQAKKNARKREENSAKTVISVKVGLILAGAFVVLLIGIGCVGGLAWVSWAGK
jgi:cobalamin biosynthesis Mg chelatase CobN